MRRIVMAFALLTLGWTVSPQVFAQFGANISVPQALHINPNYGWTQDWVPQLTTDGAGNWVVVWMSREQVGDGLGPDWDILVARSTDNGASWSAPEALNTNAGTDDVQDEYPQIATDRAGNWVAVWSSGFWTVGWDILVARSTDNGASWSAPEGLNTNAGTGIRTTSYPDLTTDGAGNWVLAWSSEEADISGGIGTDYDILFARSTDNGASWSAPEALNTNAGTDAGPDEYTQIATDSAGNWVTVWSSSEAIGGDADILFARSTDNGASWSAPEALNTNAATDALADVYPQIATDRAGNWLAVWHSTAGPPVHVRVARSTDNGASWGPPETLHTSTEGGYPQLTTDGLGNWVAMWMSTDPFVGGGIGPDSDILVSRVAYNGCSAGRLNWSAPEALNTNAVLDSGNDTVSKGGGLATDGAGNWIAAWYSKVAPGSSEWDVRVARFDFFCDGFVDHSAYGRLVFPPLCTRDAASLTQDLYDSATLGINKDTGDSFYLSSDGMSFAPLVVDDEIHSNGQGSGLGPYSYQPCVPPFRYGALIQDNLVSLPAHDVTSLIPMGSSQVLFELLDTQREIYGNTAVYLVRDCGIYLSKYPDTALHWVSHDVEIEGFQSDLDVVTGVLSALRSDQDFSQACDLGSFTGTTQAVDSRPDPPAGDGYYYLVSGTCAQPIGYGNSSAGPRTGLPSGIVCP